MSIILDFSNEKILHPEDAKKQSFTYKDIGTSNITLTKDKNTGKVKLNDINTANLDEDAIKQSLTNIFTFRAGDEILDPEFGIGKIYEMLYAPFDKYTTQKMIAILKEIINEYEPRIDLISTPVEYNEDEHEYSIMINYYIPSLLKKRILPVEIVLIFKLEM